jgi:hypothetical protein
MKSNNTNKNNNTNSSNKKHEKVFLSLNQIQKILEENYGIHLAYYILLDYVHKNIITPDYVLEKKFLFHKDRVPEIVNALKNKFHKKLSQSIQKRSQNKSENKTNEKATDNSVIELLLFFEAKNLKWRRTYFVTSCWICAKVEKCHFFKILTQNKE